MSLLLSAYLVLVVEITEVHQLLLELTWPLEAISPIPYCPDEEADIQRVQPEAPCV